MKKTKTWILIADGGRARLVARSRADEGYKPVVDTDFISDNRPDREIGTERPGRTHDRTGNARHAMENPSDPHRLEMQKLAQRIAAFLQEKQQQKAFDRLIIIAAPRTLGDLRDALPKAVQDTVIEEIDKDVTKLSLPELQDKLPEMIEATH